MSPLYCCLCSLPQDTNHCLNKSLPNVNQVWPANHPSSYLHPPHLLTGSIPIKSDRKRASMVFTERQERRLTSDLPCDGGGLEERKGDTGGYMIAGQTHKSSINPRGAKDALFSSSRQPSQTEHHHKPYTPAFLRWRPLLPQSVLSYFMVHFPLPFPSFLIRLSFLNIVDKQLYKIRTPFTPLFLLLPQGTSQNPETPPVQHQVVSRIIRHYSSMSFHYSCWQL